MKKTRKITLKKTLIASGIIMALLTVGFLVYVNDYYKAQAYVDDLIDDHAHAIQTDGRFTILRPSEQNDQNIGLVFYPGGKVEAKAYMPLLMQLSEEGITSVLVQMPFNLAVFDINAANRALKQVDGIDLWYLAGHSLGGAMASSYINNNSDKFKGLILLAAYPINDADIPTIQIYGSNDQVLDQSKIVQEVPVYVIDGGNHAYFGDYGLQAGDGVATISRNQQKDETVEVILSFMVSTNP